MSIPEPETKIFPIIGRVAEDLWQKAVASDGDLESSNPRLKRRLRFLDRLVQKLFDHSFAETFRKRHFLIDDTIIGSNGKFLYEVGYSNDESQAGLRFLRAWWDSGEWSLGVDLFHLSGYHRLDRVSIRHVDQQVDFDYPEEFIGKFVPANTFPPSMAVKTVA